MDKSPLFQYKGCGLDYVWLENGYTRIETPYGTGTKIEDSEGLDRAIALMIVERASPITGSELRFLRQLIGMSQLDIGVTWLAKKDAQPVARWEKSGNIPETEERLLRVNFTAYFNGDAGINESVRRINFMSRVKNDKTVFVRDEHDDWKVESAPKVSEENILEEA